MSRKHLLSLSPFAPPFPPFVRAMVPKMVARKQCSLGGKQRLNLWFACSTFISLPVLSCCGCDALSSFRISIHVSFFLLSLVACILQSFQTVTVSCCYITTPALKAVPGVHCTTGMCGVSHVWDCPDCRIRCRKWSPERCFQLNLGCCTLLGGTFFAPLWNLDLYVGGHRQH